MKLKVRYDENVQTIDLDAAATQELWVSLSLEGDDLKQDDKERLIQEEFEKQFNRPDYNSWHKFDRHRGYNKAQPGYEVIEIVILSPTDVTAMIESEYDLTLFTCTVGGEYRVTVRCNRYEPDNSNHLKPTP